jgi:hypothetical protein
MPRSSSVHASISRVYRHTIKRQLEASLTLPNIQKHGFTHPGNGCYVMYPRELRVLAALESKAVYVVVLTILDLTIGVVGDGPCDRRLWAKISLHALADAALLPYSKAVLGLQKALEKGYVQRRKAGRSWEYSVRWHGIQD